MAKHLKILGIGDAELLGDPRAIEPFIKSCVLRVGMQVIDTPRIINVPLQFEKLRCEPFEDEGGVTGQLIGYCTLSTSHIAIHTWPLRSEFHLDMYSCRDFNKDSFVAGVVDMLNVTKYKVSDLSHACEWD